MAVVVPTSRHSTMAMTIKDSLNFSFLVQFLFLSSFIFISFRFISSGICSWIVVFAVAVVAVVAFFAFLVFFSCFHVFLFVCLFEVEESRSNRPTTSPLCSITKECWLWSLGKLFRFFCYSDHMCRSPTHWMAEQALHIALTHCSTLELGCYRKLNWPLI